MDANKVQTQFSGLKIAELRKLHFPSLPSWQSLNRQFIVLFAALKWWLRRGSPTWPQSNLRMFFLIIVTLINTPLHHGNHRWSVLCRKTSNCSGIWLKSAPAEADFHLFSHRLIHGGQLLNGLAGPTIMSAGPFLSTTWFAPDQRATATAVATLFSYLGGATSFLVGPLVVPAPNDTLAGARLAAAVPDSSIRGRIQLVMYAGTVNMQGPPGPGRIDGTSFQHRVSSVEGRKHNQAIGF